MRRSIGMTLAAAAIVLVAAGCGGSPDVPSAPAPPALDIDFETIALATVGIAEDQANGASVVPLSAMGDPFVALAAAHGSCAFSSASGRVTCPDLVRSGITISRSYGFYDASNNVQAQRDSSTAKINTQVWARGTNESALGKITIDRKSDLTATGVARASKRRTLNGTEQGTSAMEHLTSRGKILSQIAFGDTTVGLVVPQNDPAQKWPVGGTVIHSHNGTRSLAGTSETSSVSYREVLVFDGTSKVSATITVNGQTRVCVRDLAARTQRCSP